MKLLEPNGIVFTPDSYNEVRQWVQDRSVNGEIVASPTRLYLPMGTDSMTIVVENEIIWWNPNGGPNAFSVEHRP